MLTVKRRMRQMFYLYIYGRNVPRKLLISIRCVSKIINHVLFVSYSSTTTTTNSGNKVEFVRDCELKPVQLVEETRSQKRNPFTSIIPSRTKYLDYTQDLFY